MRLLKASKIYIFFLTSAAFLIGMSATQAGFEWVPAQPAQTSETPTAPVNTKQQPAASDIDMVPLPAVQGPAQNPVPEAQTSTMQIKTITPGDAQDPNTQPAAKPMAAQMPAPEAPVQPAVSQETAIEPASAPAPVQQNIIMPQDAPESALNNVPGSKKLTINPYPDVNNASAEMPVMPISKPANTAGPAPMPPMPANDGRFEDVVGFGSDMPLALALRQIVPAEYAFSFSDGVNPGHRVSWNGGKPWNEVVQEMVAPLNLKSAITDKTVIIYKGDMMTPEPMEMGQAEPDAPPVMLVITEDDPVKRNNITDPGAETATQSSDSLQALEPASGFAQNDMAKPSFAFKTWEAKQGESLKETLTFWSRQENVELIWNASHDFTVNDNVSINDTFPGAVSTLVSDGLPQDQQPGIRFFETPGDQQKLTVIVDNPQKSGS